MSAKRGGLEMVTILTESGPREAEKAEASGDDLWLSHEELERIVRKANDGVITNRRIVHIQQG